MCRPVSLAVAILTGLHAAPALEAPALLILLTGTPGQARASGGVGPYQALLAEGPRPGWSRAASSVSTMRMRPQGRRAAALLRVTLRRVNRPCPDRQRRSGQRARGPMCSRPPRQVASARAKRAHETRLPAPTCGKPAAVRRPRGTAISTSQPPLPDRQRRPMRQGRQWPRARGASSRTLRYAPRASARAARGG